MRALTRLLALIILLAGSTACASAHASPLASGAMLDTPPPPPRVIPIESEPIVSSLPAIPETPAPSVPVRPGPVPAPSRKADAADSPPAAATAAPAPTPAPVAAPTQPSETATPPRSLQTTGNGSEAEQKVRVLILNASRDLGRIDYRALGVDARGQYDIAKRFSEQAEEALKTRNLIFAEQLAEKAAALAALLLKH